MRIMIHFIFLFFMIIFTNGVFAKDFNNMENKYISYTEEGSGQPLIMIHAFPTDHQLWTPQLEGLKQFFCVISLDLWGFGKSSPTDGTAVTMENYADEIKQLLDQLHIQKAIISGESMGGYIALAFLEKYPNQVIGLILSDTQSIADSEETKTKRESSAKDVLENGSTKLIENFMPKALSNHASDQTKKFLSKILETQKPTGIASALRGMALRTDRSNILAQAEIPILIISGDQDTLIPMQQSERMHALAKNSKLEIISNAGHLSSLEQPEQWNHAVISMFIGAS